MPKRFQSTSCNIFEIEARHELSMDSSFLLPVDVSEFKQVELRNVTSSIVPAVQLGMPIVCEEDEAVSLEICQNTIIDGEDDDLEHEEAGIKDQSALMIKKREAHQQIKKPRKTPKRKHKKGKKKRKKRHLGRQRGKDQPKSCQSNNPSENEPTAPRQVSVPSGNEHQRIAQRNRYGDGGGSDSEHEDNGRPEFYGGHYVGIPQEEEKDSIVVEEQNQDVQGEGEETSAQEEKGDDYAPMMIDSPSPIVDPELEERGIQRICEFKEKEIKRGHPFAKQVERLCIHVTYKPNCSGCPERLCPKVREYIKHVKNEHDDCELCLLVDLGLFLHAVKCQHDDCPVWSCGYWKDWIRRRHERRFTKGEIIHSTTTLFKEGTFVSEDTDYTFLQKVFLGKGTFGDAWRAWFYSPGKQREADIVVKEVKYDPSSEAKIHSVIRQNHPNLLGAMAIIKFDNPRRVVNRDQMIHGYILMERGECTLCDLKKEYWKFGQRGVPARDALYFFYQIAEALRYLHANQIVHKDVKDMNVLLFNNCQLAKLTDWDGAMFIRSEAEYESTLGMKRKGTAGFCANEVLNKYYHGFPADIFSLGAMFIEISRGGVYRRKTDETEKQCEERRQDSLEELKKVDEKLGNLIEKCLSPKPEERPTAYELVNHILLKLEQDFKPKFVNIQPPSEPILEFQEFRFLADIDGEGGEAVRQRFSEIYDKPHEAVLQNMDLLPKVLPSENLPQSSSWVGLVQEESGPPEESGSEFVCGYPDAMDIT